MRAVRSQFSAAHQHKYDTQTLGVDIQRWRRPTQFEYEPGRLDAPNLQPGEFRKLVDAEPGSFSVMRHDGNGSLKIGDWNPFAVYDQNTEQLLLAGARRKTKVVGFSNKTGGFREISQPSSDYMGTAHWYGNTATDGNKIMWNKWLYDPVEDTWFDFEAATGFTFARTGSLAWWPEYGTQGGWFNANDGDLIVYDLATEQTISLGDSGHGKHATAIHHPVSGRILIIGGTNTGTRTTLVEQDGSFNLMADAPTSYGMSTMPCFFYPDSEIFLRESGNGSTTDLLAFRPSDNEWRNEGPYVGRSGGSDVYSTYAYNSVGKFWYVWRRNGIYAHKIQVLT